MRLVHLAKEEEQLGPGVETDTHTVEDGGDVLTHVRPVGAGAVQRQLARMREHSVPGVGQHGQHVVRQLTAQQTDK